MQERLHCSSPIPNRARAARRGVVRERILRKGATGVARIVMKFGGTSMAGSERIRRVANIVRRQQAAGHEVAVVVSAMAGETDRLVNFCREANPLYDPAEYDVVVASGEQVTAGLLAMTLQALGCKARSWLGWQLPIHTDDAHAKARIESIDSEALLASMAPPLADLKAGIAEISAAIEGGIAELANLRNTIPAIVNGGGQLKGGMGGLSADAKGFLGEVTSLALTAKDKLVVVKQDAADAAGAAKAELTELGVKADNVKASITGLEMAAAQSPLPYSMVSAPTGPVTVTQAEAEAAAAASAPEGEAGEIPVTEAFGAYQFMLDPANENTVITSGRIVAGVILLIVAAGVGLFLARRRRA